MSKWKILTLQFIILLNLNVSFSDFDTQIEDETILEDFLVCRSCGFDATLSNFIIGQRSSQTLVASNETLFGKPKVLVQIIQNPIGIRFEVVSLSRASCARVGVWNLSHTWFPGYAWKLCLCPKCAAHLGWMFEPLATATKNQIFPSENGFYLLVIDNIIAESDVKSLLVGQNCYNKMVDPNRKINRLNDEDIKLLDFLEEEFVDRFTPLDEEFMEYCKKPLLGPPILEEWNVRKGKDYRQHYGVGGGSSYNSGHRSNWRGKEGCSEGRWNYKGGYGPHRHRHNNYHSSKANSSYPVSDGRLHGSHGDRRSHNDERIRGHGQSGRDE